MLRRSLKTVVATARPRFLVLTPVSLLLGCAAVVVSGHIVSPLLFALVLAGALSAHVGVNMLNEYEDFRSGLDYETVKTPFSGGSGALPAHPQLAPLVLFAAASGLVVTFLVGIFFVYLRGLGILLVGVAGVFIILTYTRWLNRYAWACLIAPGLGFGPLMVWGTAMALSGELSETALWLSLPPFFLVNNLLLLNQYPDAEADRSVGRNHFVIQYGKRLSTVLYGLFLLLAYGAIAVPVALDLLPASSLVALATAPLAIPVIAGLHRYADEPERLIKPLGLNVAIILSTILLLAVGVFIGESGVVS